MQIGELAKLTSLLARAGAARPLRAARCRCYLTEYGYQTDPPDPGQTVAGAWPAATEGQALCLGWRAARTRQFPQFLLHDIGPGPQQAGRPGRPLGRLPTGLYTHGGRPKHEVVRGFRLPFHAMATRDERGAAAVAVFGQVRPGRGTQTVEVQRRGPGRPLGGRALTGGRSGRRRLLRGLRHRRSGPVPAGGARPGSRDLPRALARAGRARAGQPARLVGQPVPFAGGADGALGRVGDDGRTPAG